MGSGDLSAVGRTAFVVSLARAAEAERGRPWFIDPLAARLAGAVPHGTRERIGRGLIAWVAVRTRFLDEVIAAALSDGVRQIVVPGAGLDARAFRLSLPDDTLLFEIDRDDVFVAKRRIMRAAALHFAGRREVVADVLDPRWLSTLEDAGWNPAEPTLWLLEGFLIYFDNDTRTRLLQRLAEVSAAGSRLGATASIRFDNRTHPLWHPFTTDDLGGWLADCGWNAVTANMTEASRRYGRPLPTDEEDSIKGVLITASNGAAPVLGELHELVADD